MQGLRRGDAQVSTSHANFIINTGNASFKDVKGLINECRKRVKESKGIDLELEVRLVND
jgi:UDP-N-acetylmuramate dehydrogenase